MTQAMADSLEQAKARVAKLEKLVAQRCPPYRRAASELTSKIEQIGDLVVLRRLKNRIRIGADDDSDSRVDH